MTLAELQTKREEIVSHAGTARVAFGDRSVEYSRQVEALELIDREIAKLQSPGDRVFKIQTNRGLS